MLSKTFDNNRRFSDPTNGNKMSLKSFDFCALFYYQIAYCEQIDSVTQTK